MRTATSMTQADPTRHLSENLMSQLAKGREWATPGVEAALQRVVAGLDSGIESASPKIQAALRRLSEELAGGVETLAPRVHEGLKRVGPKVVPAERSAAPAEARPTASGKAWLIAAVVAVAVAAGIAAWRASRPTPDEPAPSNDVPPTGVVNIDADAVHADPDLRQS